MDVTLEAHQIMAATISGAAIVMFGALYALFFTLDRLHPSRYWLIATLGSFALLMISAYILAKALVLPPLWQGAILFLLVCYYFSPRFIWHLSVATHVEEPADEPKHSTTNAGGF